MENLYIYGTSGFSDELINEMKQIDQYFDRFNFCLVTDGKGDGQKIINEKNVPEYARVIFAAGDPYVRERMYKNNQNKIFIRFSSLDAHVADSTQILPGSMIMAGTVITTNVYIGMHCLININVSIGHNCVIDDFVTISPGANISGDCHIGKRCYIGSNASIRQGVRICNDVTIGMGAVVLNDIEQPGVYVGIPARKLEEK